MPCCEHYWHSCVLQIDERGLLIGRKTVVSHKGRFSCVNISKDNRGATQSVNDQRRCRLCWSMDNAGRHPQWQLWWTARNDYRTGRSEPSVRQCHAHRRQPVEFLCTMYSLYSYLLCVSGNVLLITVFVNVRRHVRTAAAADMPSIVWAIHTITIDSTCQRFVRNSNIIAAATATAKRSTRIQIARTCTRSVRRRIPTITHTIKHYLWRNADGNVDAGVLVMCDTSLLQTSWPLFVNKKILNSALK